MLAVPSTGGYAVAVGSEDCAAVIDDAGAEAATGAGGKVNNAATHAVTDDANFLAAGAGVRALQIVDGTVDVLDDALTREFGHVGIDSSVKIFGGVTQHGVGVALVAMEQRRGDCNITRSGELVGHALDVCVCAEGFLAPQ